MSPQRWQQGGERAPLPLPSSSWKSWTLAFDPGRRCRTCHSQEGTAQENTGKSLWHCQLHSHSPETPVTWPRGAGPVSPAHPSCRLAPPAHPKTHPHPSQHGQKHQQLQPGHLQWGGKAPSPGSVYSEAAKEEAISSRGKKKMLGILLVQRGKPQFHQVKGGVSRLGWGSRIPGKLQNKP